MEFLSDGTHAILIFARTIPEHFDSAFVECMLFMIGVMSMRGFVFKSKSVLLKSILNPSILKSDEGRSYLKIRKREQNRLIRKAAFSAVIFCAAAAAFLSAFSGVSANTDNQEAQYLRDSVGRAIVSCYALEGRYPPDTDYIKEHYGVTYDSKKYVVGYQIFASNIPPSFNVIKIQGAGK